MSADNYIECPRCTSDRIVEVARLAIEASNLYGVASLEEFDAARKRAIDLAEERLQAHFREDWEIGADEEGHFYVRYSGSCSQCGLSHKFQHDERFYTPAVCS